MNRLLCLICVFCLWSSCSLAEETNVKIRYEPIKLQELRNLCETALAETKSDEGLKQTRCGAYIEGYAYGASAQRLALDYALISLYMQQDGARYDQLSSSNYFLKYKSTEICSESLVRDTLREEVVFFIEIAKKFQKIYGSRNAQNMPVSEFYAGYFNSYYVECLIWED